MVNRFPKLSEGDLTALVDQKNSDRMIKQLLNSVIVRHHDLSLSRRSNFFPVANLTFAS